MSLNDDQIADIKDNTIAGDPDQLVKTPSLIPDSNKPLTVIPDNNQTSGPPLALDPEFEKKLPELDLSFKLVSEQGEKIVDLQEVEQMILGDGQVNRDTADEINASFEGLYDGKISRNHFTDAPSTLNFKHVKDHVSRRISLENINLATNFKSMIDQPLTDAKHILTNLIENYLPDIRAKMYVLQETGMKVKEEIANSQHTVVPLQRDFVNLTKIDLTNMDNETVVGENFKQLCQGLKEILSDNRLRSIVLSLAADRTLFEASSRDAILLNSGKAVTIYDLIRFFQNSEAVRYTEVMVETAEMYISDLEKIHTEGSAIADDPEKIKLYIQENLTTLAKAASYNKQVVGQTLALAQLQFTAQQLFGFYSRLN